LRYRVKMALFLCKIVIKMGIPPLGLFLWKLMGGQRRQALTAIISKSVSTPYLFAERINEALWP
jgi:hypothetical protein